MLSCLQSRGIFMSPAGRPVLGIQLLRRRRGRRGRRENGSTSRTRTRSRQKHYSHNRFHHNRPRPLQAVYRWVLLHRRLACWRQRHRPTRRERDDIHLPHLPIHIPQSISYLLPKSQVQEPFNLNNLVTLHQLPLDSGRLKLDYHSCRSTGLT